MKDQKEEKIMNPFTHFKSGLCMSESISSLSPSVSESKFFLLYIGKCHLQKNHEKKNYHHSSFFRKIDFC